MINENIFERFVSLQCGIDTYLIEQLSSNTKATNDIIKTTTNLSKRLRAMNRTTGLGFCLGSIVGVLIATNLAHTQKEIDRKISKLEKHIEAIEKGE